MRLVKTAGKGRHWIRNVAAFGLAVPLVVLGAGTEIPWAQAPGRVIYMAAVEMKGGTQKEKEPYPETPLPSGAGYIKTPPNPAG